MPVRVVVKKKKETRVKGKDGGRTMKEEAQ
jgi:hypothetical protein